jgi:hypothetical protein
MTLLLMMPLFLSTPAPVNAQPPSPSLTVTVLDEHELQPLPGVVVTISPRSEALRSRLTQTHETDGMGRAIFRGTPYAAYDVSCVLHPFAESKVLNVCVRPEGQVRITIVLNYETCERDGSASP